MAQVTVRHWALAGSAVLALAVTACTAVTSATTTTAATSVVTTGGSVEPVPTTAAGALPSDRLGAGTPPAELQAYRAVARLEIEAGEFTAAIESSGVRVDESFECVATYAIRGETSSERVVGDLAGVWYGTPVSLEETTYADTAVDGLLELCPVSTRFWSAFDPRSLNEVTATGFETINGTPTARYDLSPAIADFRVVEVVPAFEGLDLQQLEVWRETEAGWIVRMVVAVSIDPDVLGATLNLPELSTGEPGVMRMTVDITAPNDASLRVALPR